MNKYFKCVVAFGLHIPAKIIVRAELPIIMDFSYRHIHL